MAEPVQRSTDIEERSNALVFQPLSTWLAPILVRARISANATSLLGMAAGVVGALFYGIADAGPGLVLAGFALMCLWHVLDGADGQVARLTNTQSPLGKLIDGICDYVVFTAAYVALALRIEQTWPGYGWPLVAVSGLFHAVQAGAYEAQRQMFDYWGLGKQSARIGAPSQESRAASRWLVLIRIYEWVQLKVTAITPAYLARLEQVIGTPAKDNPASQAYCHFFAASVRSWGVMCANYRTYGLFLACLVQRPALYFLVEIAVLGPLHLWLVARQARLNRAFASGQTV